MPSCFANLFKVIFSSFVKIRWMSALARAHYISPFPILRWCPCRGSLTMHFAPAILLVVILPFLFLPFFKSNFNSLANQLGIHIILAKQEKLVSNSLANQLGKNRNLAKLTSPRAYMRARIVIAIVVSL
jgi:hypothetical protein